MSFIIFFSPRHSKVDIYFSMCFSLKASYFLNDIMRSTEADMWLAWHYMPWWNSKIPAFIPSDPAYWIKSHPSRFLNFLSFMCSSEIPTRASYIPFSKCHGTTYSSADTNLIKSCFYCIFQTQLKYFFWNANQIYVYLAGNDVSMNLWKMSSRCRNVSWDSSNLMWLLPCLQMPRPGFVPLLIIYWWQSH